MKEKDESKENKNMTEEKGHKLYSIECMNNLK